AEGQSVICPLNRRHHQFYVMIKLFNHLLQDPKLLDIFLPKNGHIRLYNVKQFVDHQQNALEKAGPRLAVHMIVQLLHFNAKKLPGRIHSLIRWSNDGGNVLSLTRRKISFQLARVFLIVLIRPKLFRIDIDRYDYLIGMLMSPSDKRKVTSMQSSHRWNESYRLSLLFELCRSLTDIGNGANCFHINRLWNSGRNQKAAALSCKPAAPGISLLRSCYTARSGSKPSSSSLILFRKAPPWAPSIIRWS